MTPSHHSSRGSRITRWLREPLLHFLAIGAVLFAAHAWINRGETDRTDSSSRTVRITANEVDWLKEMWARQWQRPPDERELKGLVTDYLNEELLANEAKELGLADNDTVVRRRLAQKMEFIVQDTARATEPGEDELRRFYEAHRDRYQTPARISFVQVYFNPDEGGTAGSRAVSALEQLSKSDTALAHSGELGGRSLLPTEFLGENETAVASLFGAEFARQVFALEPGGWNGPVTSAYGLHLVRVSEKQAARVPEFGEIQAAVSEDWHRQHQQAEKEKYFASLLKKYDVVIDESVKPLFGPPAEAIK